VLPPPVVQVRVSTRDARAETACPTMLVFLAPAGSLLLARGRWQSVRRPLLVTEQVPPFLPPLRDAADAETEGTADARTVAEGLGDALALGVGVVLALATPLSASVPAAVRTITAHQRPMPDVLFRFNVGPPRQIRRCHRDGVSQGFAGISARELGVLGGWPPLFHLD
jgi:hypothetical protein